MYLLFILELSAQQQARHFLLLLLIQHQLTDLNTTWPTIQSQSTSQKLVILVMVKLSQSSLTSIGFHQTTLTRLRHSPSLFTLNRILLSRINLVVQTSFTWMEQELLPQQDLLTQQFQALVHFQPELSQQVDSIKEWSRQHQLQLLQLSLQPQQPRKQPNVPR